jgi:hypothetical protein
MRIRTALATIIVLLLPILASATQPESPSEIDFLKSCYELCAIFHKAPDAQLPLAQENLKDESSIDLFTHAMRINATLQGQKTFNEELTAETLSENAMSWIFGLYEGPFPAPGLTPLETAAIQQYTGEDARILNRGLRPQNQCPRSSPSMPIS